MKELVLASNSVSRRDILLEAGYSFIVDPSNYEENMALDMPPTELAIHLSRGKAEDVATRHKESVILGVDSFAVFDNQLLGKPHTIDKAKEMLAMLSGNIHLFLSGFTLIDSTDEKIYSGVIESKVHLKVLSAAEIIQYITSENILEVAGAYKIQGLGRNLITKLDGDINNVRGLPIKAISKQLNLMGINPSIIN